jgi:hypothetical protein
MDHDLSHVLWIGGSTCSGKSSIAGILGQEYRLPVYHYDRHERLHIARMTPEEYPLYTSAIAGTMDERWVQRTPEQMYRGVVGSWAERFRLVVDDLMLIQGEPFVIAEGPGLFPGLVAPLLWSPHQAIWLVSSDDVIRRVRATRPTAIRDETSDPDRAIENIIARDTMFASHIREEARKLDLKTLEIDWTHSLAETAALVEKHFEPLLRIPDRSGSAGL